MLHSEIVIDQHYGGLNPVQFGYETCSPGHFYGPAVRVHWLLHYVISGFGIYEYENTIYKIKPGEIFVIPPYVKTYYRADMNKPWKYIWIGFTTESSLPKCFYQPVIRCPGAGSIFDEMIACNNLENGRSAYLSSCLWKLMSVLLDQDRPAVDYVDKAIHYMHSSFADGITIQDIAQSLNLDRSYFSTIFSQKMGISPQEYLINLRLEKAAELMIRYHETPSTAATSVGYFDISQFSKIFKKHFGMSPREYQKSFDIHKYS